MYKPLVHISYLKRPLSRNKNTVSIFTHHTFTTLQAPPFSDILEEDQHPDFCPERYYPAHIGDDISGRYRLISKVGWGANSTVWLARNIKLWRWLPSKYVTIKIACTGRGEHRSAQEEPEISQHISRLRSVHEGQRYIRQAVESFKIQGPLGKHVCLVFDPLREPLWLLGKHLGSDGVPPGVLKPFLKIILQGLDFLHSECKVIHTDLKADNFLIGFEDPAVLESYVRYQEADPAPYKLVDGHPIYKSRPDFGPLRKGVGLLRISDFSTAVFGSDSRPHNHYIQPQPFCAPEVLLKATWSYSADIWNLGNVLWELLTDNTLLNGMDPRSTEYSREAHIAQVIRLLGPPPSTLLEKADKTICSELFTNQGEFRFPDLIPSENFNFYDRTTFLHGEDQRLFIEFAKRMLQWDPEKRATAKELCDDPWLSFKS